MSASMASRLKVAGRWFLFAAIVLGPLVPARGHGQTRPDDNLASPPRAVAPQRADERLTALLRQARASALDGDMMASDSALVQAFVLAGGMGDKALARCESTRGLLITSFADRSTTTSAERDSLLRVAERCYRAAIELDPTLAAAQNNLGEILCNRGMAEQSLPYFRRAMASNKARRGIYALNHGECSTLSGRSGEAERYLHEALDSLPSEPQVREKFWLLFQQQPRMDVAAFLWKLVRLRQFGAAEQYAAATMRLPGASDDMRREAAVALVVALTNREYLPPDFLRTATAETLRVVARDPALSGCASEILELYGAANVSAEAYPWWTSQARLVGPRDAKVRPIDAFAKLSRLIGQGYEMSKDVERAERSYRASMALERSAASPAVVDLVRVLRSQSKAPSADSVLVTQTNAARDEKVQRQSLGELEKSFSYHRSMALMSSRGGKGFIAPQGPEFHLAQAAEYAALYNARATPRDEPDTLLIDPLLVERVAENCAAWPAVAYRVRLDSAEWLLRQHRESDAIAVLEPVGGKPRPYGVAAADSVSALKIMRAATKRAVK